MGIVSNKGSKYSMEVKQEAVRRLANGTATYETEAKRIGCHEKSISNWVRLYGASSPNLPTTKATRAKRAKQASLKTRALIAISFACPHCGGPVEVPA